MSSKLHKLKSIFTTKKTSTNFNTSTMIMSKYATMELPNQLKQVFNLIDSNGDGKISPLELKQVLQSLGYDKSIAAREAEGMVKEMDSDGDGFIDLEEFMKVVAKDGDYKKLNEELMQAFLVFDIDKNGFISAKELRRVLVGLGHGSCSVEDCRAMIKAFDKNGDGLVDFNEFQDMMTINTIINSTSKNHFSN
ncbi:probable calcium-binding protein CML23 [Dioscorea cayenensis subsp. rotundata]|nr:probable calcium-binding protein CML23 [Dioscorea cayenensis subsp. rotundata]